MRYVATLLTAISLALATPSAHAAPPISDENGHVHHVDTGAGCVAIDAVRFLGGHRGLHRGADSSGADQGPEHQDC